MILEIKSGFNTLHIDNDEEDFEFYNAYLTDDDYLGQWKDGLSYLHSSNKPALLPVYADIGSKYVDLQGYVIYPHKSAWILIDRGVKIPKDIELSNSYSYVNPIETELPENEKVWQSHWWVSGRELSALSNELGLNLQFQNGQIPVEPLNCVRMGTEITIYADRSRFDIEYSTFDNMRAVQEYSIQQLECYSKNDMPVVSIPASITVDNQMTVLSFFRKDSYEYIAQSYLDTADTILDQAGIKSLIGSYNPPYLHNHKGTYGYHARYKPGTINKLRAILE